MMFGLSEEACFWAAVVTAGHAPASKVVEHKRGKDNFISIKFTASYIKKDIATKVSHKSCIAYTSRGDILLINKYYQIQSHFVILTHCHPNRLRIACFGPTNKLAATDEAETGLFAGGQEDSEMFTFKIEEK